ncbi:HNH endonuclease [Mycobacteroides franklinii]|uniref:HNH endonuclease n=1 Tax=Mycobacteroides franklinii TaxID=948102 RepID=UPI0013E8D93E|nr:hypothetical protein [Mycobacteroides franklinii]
MPTSSKNGPRSLGRTGVKFEKAKARVLRASQICDQCHELIDLNLKWPDPKSATVDHIIPVKDLAWDDPLCYDVSNLVPCHLVCNQRRGGKAKTKVKHPTSRNWRE